MHPPLGLLVGDETHSLPWVGLCGDTTCGAWACAQHMSMCYNLRLQQSIADLSLSFMCDGDADVHCHVTLLTLIGR